ncbi:MAG: 2-iminobutanoate/2-iminopropanoate deaminase [Clostridia bacterium]|nr:2-iminobutanoate/2-iminopropanoate deaminase [Clostridia bacterium]
MNKSAISTAKAPAAIGPYSQAIRYGDLVFTSGQIPIDPASGTVVAGGIEAQTRQVMRNLEEVLLAAGASLTTVLKTTVFIKNMDDFGKVNEIYAEFFNSDPPARSCVEVARLPKDVLVEIEAVAYVAQ